MQKTNLSSKIYFGENDTTRTLYLTYRNTCHRLYGIFYMPFRFLIRSILFTIRVIKAQYLENNVKDIEALNRGYYQTLLMGTNHSLGNSFLQSSNSNVETLSSDLVQVRKFLAGSLDYHQVLRVHLQNRALQQKAYFHVTPFQSFVCLFGELVLKILYFVRERTSHKQYLFPVQSFLAIEPILNIQIIVAMPLYFCS